MDNRYILTPSGSFVSVDELYHHGIKGMKWGVRRFQNKDGTLTPIGKKRLSKGDEVENEYLNRPRRAGEALSKLSGKNISEIIAGDKGSFQADVDIILTQTYADRISSKNPSDIKEAAEFIKDGWKYEMSITDAYISGPNGRELISERAKRYYDDYVKNDPDAYAKSIIEEIEYRELNHSDIDELYHHGTKGMKWGVRRYQNPDGSLTAAGRKRYTNSDGTLNKRGEKYYAKETARLKAESERLANEKKTSSKLVKLDKMRQKNSDVQGEIDGKKTETESKATITKLPKEHDVSSLTTKEIQDYNNRMQSEENFKQLLERRGYKVSLDQKTEIDQRIDELNKQKTLMQLEKDVANMSRGKSATEERIAQLTQQRDIAKLEKEIRDNTPKKESKISKFMNSQAGQNITNQLIKSGENLLTSYMKNQNDKNANLSSAGAKETAKKVGKILGDEAEKVAKSVEKQQKKQAAQEAKAAEKEAKKEAKSEAKAEAKQAKKEAKAAEKEAKKEAKAKVKEPAEDADFVDRVGPKDYTVTGEGASKSRVKNEKQTGPVYDADFVDVSDNGKSYVSQNSNSSITSLLSNSSNTRESHEYVKRFETDYGYRYLYELPSSVSNN